MRRSSSSSLLLLPRLDGGAGDFSGSAMLALVLALVLFIPRFPVLFILDRKTTPRRDALIAWSLVPRGLSASALAQYAVGSPARRAWQVVNLMVFLSITAVAVSVFLIEARLPGPGRADRSRTPLRNRARLPRKRPQMPKARPPREPVAALDAPAPPSPEPEPAETPTENPSERLCV